MPRDLNGAGVIVAGATGGLGSPIARLLAAHGAQLLLLARDEGRLLGSGLPGSYVAGDLADADVCEHAVAATLKLYGNLTGVVNAAGVVAFGDLVDTDDATLTRLVNTNLLGPLRLARAALPHLAPGGFLANISAVVAEMPQPSMAAYSATKAGLTAADRALAKELRRRRIDVVDLRPPHTETGLADHPVAGTAPKLPTGLDPQTVAERVVAAIIGGEREVASDQFG